MYLHNFRVLKLILYLCAWCCNLIVCLFYFSIVYGFQAVNPRISKLTATAAKTCANVSWEYKGPEYVNLYVEYGVAGSKKQLHYWLLISAINFKRLRTFLRIYYGSSWKITWSNLMNRIYLKKWIVNHQPT